MATDKMGGFLVPDHFVSDLPGAEDMILASVIWGLSLGITIFSCAKAFRQTRSSFHRRKRLTAYVAFVWLEIASSITMGVIIWLYFRAVIPPSFQYFFAVSICWSIQVQCLIQIIANRVGLLMVLRSDATRLKWVCFAILLAVNISVICIWVPARLQINQRFIDINKVWDRAEKVIFAILDATLNLYFVFVVKKQLISNGLRKYNLLYRVNLVLIGISISLDILLICVMSLPYDYIYAQFHPLVYLIKLHIEMNMADLIGKIARARNDDYINDRNAPSGARNSTSQPQRSRFGVTLTRTHIQIGEEDELELNGRENLAGIQKTSGTEIIRSGPSRKDHVVLEHHERAVSQASSSNV